jgi:uncharacterized protein (TIGR00369 family)
VAAVDIPDGFEPDPDLDPAETHVGPYLRRIDGNGLTIGLPVAERHCNEHGALHGGVQMALADYAAGATARFGMGGEGTVTVSFDASFVDVARAGDWVEAWVEVVRRTGTLTFLRGELRCGERIVLSFSSIVRRLRPPAR